MASKRNMSRTIAENLHLELQILLWNLKDLHTGKGQEVDYFQVFELTRQENKQVIVHKREQPYYRREWMLTLIEARPITRTIWCVNNVLMFPNDY